MRRHPRCHRPAAGALIIAAGLILTGCTSGSAGVHLQTADPPSRTQVTSLVATVATTVVSSRPVTMVAPSNSQTPSGPGPSTSALVTSTKVEDTPTSAVPWPATFTAAQQSYAKGALAAFTGFVRVSTAAEKQPGKDWTTAIRKYAGDPTAAKTLEDVASLATAKVHATVTETHEAPRVLSATAKEVVLESCVDGSKAAIADATGKIVDLRPSAHPRVLVTFNVSQCGLKAGGWLVRETVAPSPAKSC